MSVEADILCITTNVTTENHANSSTVLWESGSCNDPPDKHLCCQFVFYVNLIYMNHLYPNFTTIYMNKEKLPKYKQYCYSTRRHMALLCVH